ncbi:MAG: 16S rRNA (cytosine(1402)-N(4))-methyltransferase RsmH [Planctomycetota bacterium]
MTLPGGPAPHVPVLSKEVIEHLALAPGLAVVDGTVGLGGHAAAIAEAIGPGGVLIGLDRDAQALDVARQRLARASARVELVHANFRHLVSVLRDLGLEAVDRVFLDLGVNSSQLDDPGRGMSFRLDGPIDMRFDPSSGPTAFDLLRKSSEQELAGWFHEFGEERHARRIARALVRAREQHALPRTTGELADAVVRAVPPAARRQRIHPATRVFQALRIVVNDELRAVEGGLDEAFWSLRHEGRLGVISFHSLEDRRVKRFMRERMQALFKKPILASREERLANPRSRSAKLRVAARRAATSDLGATSQERAP